MVDTTVGADLPTPEQMRAYNDVLRASWNAARMREASRALITGNIALAVSVVGATLSVMRDDWARANGSAPFIACFLQLGYLASLPFAIRFVNRQRAKGLVTVVDRREEKLKKTLARPRKTAALFIALVAFNIVCIVAWSFLFRRMSDSLILASLALGPLIVIGYFVYRFATFRFWEDLLFGAAIGLAFAPFFLYPLQTTPLSFVGLMLVAVATWSLQHRWLVWTRSLADLPGDEASVGVKP